MTVVERARIRRGQPLDARLRSLRRMAVWVMSIDERLEATVGDRARALARSDDAGER